METEDVKVATSRETRKAKNCKQGLPDKAGSGCCDGSVHDV